ncbi:MAG: hypothetical protein AB7F43_09715 [Bacteriovoracia bacterium]
MKTLIVGVLSLFLAIFAPTRYVYAQDDSAEFLDGCEFLLKPSLIKKITPGLIQAYLNQKKQRKPILIRLTLKSDTDNLVSIKKKTENKLTSLGIKIEEEDRKKPFSDSGLDNLVVPVNERKFVEGLANAQEAYSVLAWIDRSQLVDVLSIEEVDQARLVLCVPEGKIKTLDEIKVEFIKNFFSIPGLKSIQIAGNTLVVEFNEGYDKEKADTIPTQYFGVPVLIFVTKSGIELPISAAALAKSSTALVKQFRNPRYVQEYMVSLKVSRVRDYEMLIKQLDQSEKRLRIEFGNFWHGQQYGLVFIRGTRSATLSAIELPQVVDAQIYEPITLELTKKMSGYSFKISNSILVDLWKKGSTLEPRLKEILTTNTKSDDSTYSIITIQKTNDTYLSRGFTGTVSETWDFLEREKYIYAQLEYTGTHDLPLAGLNKATTEFQRVILDAHPMQVIDATMVTKCGSLDELISQVNSIRNRLVGSAQLGPIRFEKIKNNSDGTGYIYIRARKDILVAALQADSVILAESVLLFPKSH